MSKALKAAKRYVKPCKGTADVMVKSGDVDDIITVIIHADKLSVGSTKKFAPHLKGATDLATLENVYHFVRDHIRYVRDPDNEEIIKTPGCTIAEGKADCKSMTVLTGSLLRDLGFQFVYRVAFYDPRQPQQGHIYSVVQLGGKKVIVDPVHEKFNYEITPWKFQDYTPYGISQVAGLGALLPELGRSYYLPLLALLGISLLLHD